MPNSMFESKTPASSITEKLFFFLWGGGGGGFRTRMVDLKIRKKQKKERKKERKKENRIRKKTPGELEENIP